MQDILVKQQKFFKEGKTLDLQTRLNYLKNLRKVIKDNEELVIAKNMICDMNQVCKDTIRQLDLSMIQSNINQIDNEIDKVKSNI